MTVPLDLSEVDDVELTSRAREGDERAVVELWTRHYPAALTTARRVARQPRDAEELASDAFSGMLAALSSGGGPTGSVRAYLLTSVRNGVTTRARRANASDILTDEDSVLENAARVPPDPVAAAGELGLMREAFATLPTRWQHVLWRTAVDHESNIAVATELGVSANAVAALARRARQGLRAAYVQVHVSRGAVEPGCAPYIGGLAAMLTTSEGTTATAEHVRGCARCTERLAELRRVDQNLAGVLSPALLALLPGGLGTLMAAAPAGAGAATSGAATSGVATSGPATSGPAASGSANWVALATAAVVGGSLLTWALWPERPVVDQVKAAQTRTLTSTPTSSPPTTATQPPTSTRPPAPTPSRRPSSPPSPRSTTPRPVVAPPPSVPSATSTSITTSTTTQPLGQLAAGLAMGGPTTSPFIQVSASGQEVAGGLSLSLSVPTGVVLVSSSGSWHGCAQSGTTITCTASAAPAATGQSWSGTISTRWAAGASGAVSAVVTGTYRSGSAASARAATRWPPP
ncbi:RNA polymerase sigma factor [Nostocoides sp. HKS02]|uniref:RNA polymerase sigma factor n=1 Tax=Nostocoides sp. HKS02 TaxID=1813880 RepID=UPI0012B4600C|nr:sigma-70 family RNA polymerase sigma factor [Tetrasphaera sp. HKS02]QGN58970.1 sigma-70 family RNA polymerase sigma factor [Tetrasphaera sp. HKS02]